MKLKRMAALCAVVALTLGIAGTWQTTGTLHTTGDLVQQRCDQGQSQAVIEIPATTGPGPTPTPVATGTPTAGPTSTPGPFGGLITFQTATNSLITNAAASPNPYGSPLAITPANSSTYTSTVNAIPTSGPELKYYVTLGADQWVSAKLSSPDPNLGTATVKITCTSAVAFRGGSGGGGGGSVSSIVAGTCISATPAAGPNVTVSYTCSTPGPQNTQSPTPGQGISITGSYPYNVAESVLGLGFPFTIVQDVSASNFNTTGTTITVSLPNTATTGNTLLAIVATNGSADTITTPSGYTKIFATASAATSQVAAYIKTSAGSETGFTASIVSTATTWGVRFYEISGTHSLDAEATAAPTIGSDNTVKFPALTPSAGAMVFAATSLTQSSTHAVYVDYPTQWKAISVGQGDGLSSAANALYAMVYLGAGTGSALVPPRMSVLSTSLFTTTVPTGIFSIL